MKKSSIILFIAGLVALLVIQKEVVMPFVFKVIQSDLFLVDSKDKGGPSSISTPFSKIAYMHCNSQIKSKFGPDVSVKFPENPINAWSLGNYQYIINSEFETTSGTDKPISKKYACRINYKNGDDENGSLDFANWSIDGISGLDSI